ncbi:AraC family transcriptional regulator [Escherichia coli]|uniref:AraC family transcriptional regulator n=1 Tax=Escherichia coli TaxID=562 RepID=UPI000DEBB675|nr:AraC family transcriptional regulator [Escherichia coli]RBQ41319.1 AraC family transcriptional regulator [Escherichia coli]
MKSQKTLNNLNLPNESIPINPNMLEIRNIHFYECTIIYLYDAQLILKASNGQKVIIFPKSICYIEKNTTVDIVLNHRAKEPFYSIYSINHHILNYVYEVMSPLFVNQSSIKVSGSNFFSFSADDVDRKIFNRLVDDYTPLCRKVYKLTYLLSKCSDIESVVYSLSNAKNTTFAEKIRGIIITDLSRAWHLNDFAKMLYMSEVSIRKKLEKEKTKSKRLILDIKMNYAIKMILTTEKHINTISKDVGYASTSYFIRKFKHHFGITPKQLSIKFKKNYGRT